MTVVVSLFIASLSGCGGDSSTGPEPGGDLGSFEITYSGDASGTISGPAFFLEHELQGQDQTFVAFSVFGVEVEAQEDGFGMAREGRQPGPGTYDISDSRSSDPPAGSFDLTIYEDTENLSVDAISGSVTITESSSDRVAGSFEATLTGSMGGTRVTVSATGSFDAVSCQDNVADCPSSALGS